MAITQTPPMRVGSIPTGRVTQDTAATNSAVKNISNGPAWVRSLKVDNSTYATKVYLKIWDSTNPVLGTTAPDFIVPIPASKTRTLNMKTWNEQIQQWVDGIYFRHGLSYAVTTDDGTSGAAAPATPPTVWPAYYPVED